MADFDAEWFAGRLGDRTTHGIARETAALIRNGVLPVGSKLPPVRDIAYALGVSPATVSTAWSDLRRHKIIEGRGRNGAWVGWPDDAQMEAMRDAFARAASADEQKKVAAAIQARAIEQVSIGDYILSGGEMGALVLLDACIRLIPGVMGAPSSGDEESFEGGLLEYPHYTRPQTWEGRTIPEVLRSGDHAKIAAWRKSMAEADTRLRRPDLWERHGGDPVQSPSGARRKDRNE